MSIITSFSFILLIIVHYVVSIEHIDVHLLFKSLNSGCDSIYNHFLQESSLFLLFVSRFYFIVWTTYWDGRWNVGGVGANQSYLHDFNWFVHIQFHIHLLYIENFHRKFILISKIYWFYILSIYFYFLCILWF